jgi:3-deoxy-D-manno-octulosonic-acid transferase
MAGEEKILIDAFTKLQRSFPELWLIIAPRHPERFNEVARLLRATSVPFTRRSEWIEEAPMPAEPVLLLDSIGELASIYQICDIAFVGGTLVPSGGHNILEPAFFGKAIVVGPYMENFGDILRGFMDQDAGVRVPGARVGSIAQVSGPDAFFAAVKFLLDNPRHAERLGASARSVVVQNRELGTRTLNDIAQMLRAS